MQLPVVTWASTSGGSVPCSSTTCIFLKLEPSLSSINETAFDWRRVRTQPLMVIFPPGGWPSASRTEMLSIRMALLILHWEKMLARARHCLRPFNAHIGVYYSTACPSLADKAGG